MRKWILPTVLTFAVASVTRTAYADGPSDLQGLLNDTVITTASKSAETSSSAPATSTLIGAEDLKRFGIHSLDEALDFLSLGMVTSSALGSPEVGSRGVLLTRDQARHVLILVNGHAINEPVLGSARVGRGLGVPIEIIDHIEVILGPGSVLYGSNAMLGVINVITKHASEFHGLHFVVETEIAKSYRAAAGAGYDFSLFGRRSELTIEGEYYAQSGPDFTVGPQNYGNVPGTNTPFRFSPNLPENGIWGGRLENTNYAQVPSGELRLVTGPFELNAHVSVYTRGDPFNSHVVSPEADFDDPGNRETDQSYWVDLTHRVTLSPIVQMKSRLYGDVFRYERSTHYSWAQCNFPYLACVASETKAANWAGLEEQFTFNWLKDSTFVTLVGADGRLRNEQSNQDVSYADVHSKVGMTNFPPFDQFDTQDAVFGAYAQQTWNPLDALALNAGARLDDDPRFGTVVVPRAAVTTRPWRDGVAKAIYAEAYRAPTWEESLGSVPFNLLASTNLRPETVRSIEATIEQRFGAHRILFGAFRTWWRDLVELHQYNASELAAALQDGQAMPLQASATQYRNLALVDNYGSNALVEGSFGRSVHYAVNATTALAFHSNEAGASTPLTVAPSVFGNARLSYDLGGDWPTVAIAARYMGKRLADSAFVSGWVPYAPPQTELRLTLSGDVPLVRGVSYRASADYAFSSVSPYVIGPVQQPLPTQSTYELAPVDTFRASISLRYDL
jgi:outer membrane receptor for ferrienterochelin and colicins